MAPDRDIALAARSFHIAFRFFCSILIRTREGMEGFPEAFVGRGGLA